MSGDPILIGHTAGETGFLEFYDMPIRNGIELAIAEVNAAGGVLGRPIELVTSDNQSDIARLETSALEVVEAGADFVVTTCDFDFGGPAARVATDAGLLAISCAGGPLYGVEGIGPLAFNIYHGSPTEGAIMAEFADERGWTKPFILTDESIEYSRVIGEYFETRWTELGGTLAGSAGFNNADDSIAAQIAEVRNSGADVLMLPSYAPGGPAALRQIRAAGIDIPVLGANAMDGLYWLEAVPDLSDFYILSTGSIHGDDPSSDRTAFFESFEQATGAPPLSANYALTGYSIVEALATGLVFVPTVSLMTVSVAVALMAALYLILQRTRIGLQLRAVAIDLEAAQLMGIRVGRVVPFAFAISGVLASAASIIVVGQNGVVTPAFGLTPVIFGLTAAIVGGMGSIRGAIVGGLLLGAASQLLRSLLPQSVVSYRDALLFAGVFVLLVVCPSGIVSDSRGERI